MQRVVAVTMMLLLVALAPAARAQSPSPTSRSSPSPASRSPSPTSGSSPSPASRSPSPTSGSSPSPASRTSGSSPSPAVNRVAPTTAPAGTSLTAKTQLTGRAEVPPNPTPVTGTCDVTINNNKGNYSLSVTDTTGLALVHLHTGSLTSIDSGNTTTTSAVVLLYTIPPNQKVISNQQGSFVLTANGTINVKTLDGLATQIKQGNVYCDVHKIPVPPAPGPSAIRGQLAAQSTA